MTHPHSVFTGLLAFLISHAAFAQVIVGLPTGTALVPVRSWKAMRDARIVKQDKDYSCGAASLATILNEYYGRSITEDSLLMAMDKGEMRASFDDMARVLPQFGFRAVAYVTSYEQLTQLKVPVLVYLKHRKDDHFSVLRGINGRAAWLADPSLGNRYYSKEQFLEMWRTRDDPILKGRILVVLPLGVSEASPPSDFFSRDVQRRTDLAESLQTVRPH